MSSLHLENLPSELYQRLAELARADRLSIGDEAIKLLQQAVSNKVPSLRPNVPALLAEIRRHAIVPPPGTPDSVELLREDRNR